MQLNYTWWLVYSGKHYALVRVSLTIYFFAYKCIVLMTKSDGLAYFNFENYTINISHDRVFERYLLFRHYADSKIVVELYLYPIKLAICFLCYLYEHHKREAALLDTSKI